MMHVPGHPPREMNGKPPRARRLEWAVRLERPPLGRQGRAAVVRLGRRLAGREAGIEAIDGAVVVGVGDVGLEGVAPSWLWLLLSHSGLLSARWRRRGAS